MLSLGLRRVIFISGIFFLGSSVFAQTGNGGRSAFDFLKISPVCRALGAGDAYTALGDDIGSIYYNPAGLSSVLTNELNFTYLSLYQDINYEFIAFAYPLSAVIPSLGGTIAVGIDLLQPGSMQRLDDTGTVKGTFSSADEIFTLAYARTFGANVQVGISGKLIQQQIDTISTSAIDVDAGIVVVPPFEGMRVGISFKNLGAQAASFDLPFTMNSGISYRRYELFSEQDDGAITAEAVFPLRPIEDRVGMRVGFEYNFKWIGSRATLRGGYRFLDTDLGGDGLTAGAGYGLDFGGASLFLDYAFMPADIFGAAHRISLTSKF
jgi:hypothetical protein